VVVNYPFDWKEIPIRDLLISEMDLMRRAIDGKLNKAGEDWLYNVLAELSRRQKEGLISESGVLE
jgi:hypothetical protein